MTQSFEQLCASLDALAGSPEDLLAELKRHEAELKVTDFGAEHAWMLGSALRAAAAERNLPAAISIVLGKQRVFHAALTGASAANDQWAARKINTVQTVGRSSFAVGVQDRLDGGTIHNWLPEADFAIHGGGFPLATPAGALLGVVAVSGLPQAHDHALAVVELARLLGSEAI